MFSYFPFGFEGRIWDLIVSVPDHCLSFYLSYVLDKGICDIFIFFVAKPADFVPFRIHVTS